MIKKLTSLAMLAVLVLLPALTVYLAPVGSMNRETLTLAGAEAFLRDNMVKKDLLTDVARTFRMSGGLVEQNGVFYSTQGLVEDFQPQDQYTVSGSNNRAVIHFSQDSPVPVAQVLIPTARAVKQKQLPALVVSQGFNQKNFIEDCYRTLAGKVTTIEAYQTLITHMDDYLYYRTDPCLTSHGAFLVYQEIASRLRFKARGISDFSLSYPSHSYVGPLYQRWGNGGVEPDILTLYTPAGDTPVGYKVSHSSCSRPRDYRTLYPLYLLGSETPTDVFLGGYSPRMDITVSGSNSGEDLLVFGDRAASTVLPMLTYHYKSITFVDLSLIREAELAALELDDYSQVLLAYSVDTYATDASLKKLNGLVAEE